jgi:hypothetical protein
MVVGGVKPIEQAAVIELTAAEILELYTSPFDVKLGVNQSQSSADGFFDQTKIPKLYTLL